MAYNETKEGISSIKVMLESVNDNRVKASSISVVPYQLRESGKEAYEPKVVSIGPLHWGTRRELLYMEEIKWRCTRSLLNRTKEPNKSLEECWKVIWGLDEVVRATYANGIRFNTYELAKIMLFDGCFLLELLVNNARKSDKDEESCPGAKAGKMEHVLSDLKLLENQIPIFILVVLFQILFPDHISSYREKFPNLFLDNTTSGEFIHVRKIVNGLALFLFGCSSIPIPVESADCAHFLELIHWFMKDEIGQENNSQLNCATSLEAARARVKIEPLHAESGSISIRLEDDKIKEVPFGSDKKFSQSEGKLEIQPLHINKMTEVQWRNFIAWEQNRITHEKFLVQNDNPTPCKFTQYALLFNDLVCCEHDVQLLKDKGVLLVEDKKMSNEEVMTLFREIVKGIQTDASGDCRFGQHDLNCKNLWHQFRKFVTSTRYLCRDLFKILIRDHTPTVWKTIGVLAAIVLLGLTIAQTVLAAISL